jgi:hypothetical protein
MEQGRKIRVLRFLQGAPSSLGEEWQASFFSSHHFTNKSKSFNEKFRRRRRRRRRIPVYKYIHKNCNNKFSKFLSSSYIHNKNSNNKSSKVFWPATTKGWAPSFSLLVLHPNQLTPKVAPNFLSQSSSTDTKNLLQN